MSLTMKLVALTLALFSGCSIGAPADAQQGQDQYVLMQTTRGPIMIRVYYSVVPYTAGNFLDLVDRGFYDGLIFHRVEPQLIQGGDPNGNGTGDFIDPESGRRRNIKLQIDRRLSHNQAGMVAMARSSDRDSASCQFYILKRAMPQFDGQYAVFGRVVRGLGSVNAMGRGDRIISARIVDPQGGSSSGGGGGSSNSPVPGVAEPRQQVPPSPTGDSGF